MPQLRDGVTRPAVVERSRGQNPVRSGPEEGLISKDCGVPYGVSGDPQDLGLKYKSKMVFYGTQSKGYLAWDGSRSGFMYGTHMRG